MAQRMQMLKRKIAADFIVDDYRTHGVAFEFAADQRRGNAALFEIGEQVDVEEQPVGQHYQAFDAAIKQHLEIALEAAALVVNVGENWQVGSLIETILDAAQHQRAVGVGHVEYHDADRMAALAAKGPGKLIGTVAQFFRGALDAFFCDGGNVTRQWRVIQHDRNRGRRETALFGYIANRDHLGAAFAVPNFLSSYFSPLLEFIAEVGGHYSRELRSVSRAYIRWGFLWLLFTAGAAGFLPAQNSVPKASGNSANPASTGASRASRDPAQLFQAGQDALNANRLSEAENDFREVIALNPQIGGAYANLGVVYMRRKQWPKAVEALKKAEHLMPQVAGIRLNIGLVYFRQNQFLKAIPVFESVVRDQPDAVQPRHLLGLCYFFDERWTDAAHTLEPLWTQESAQLSYLYVLSIAAHRAGLKDLDEKATTQLVKIGDGSPEFHLFMGKAHLNLEQYDLALADFQAAAQANPKLTFVHFNLGLAYLKKQDYEHARDEFLQDAAVEPDLAFNYDELGDVYSLMQQDSDAEKNYREALRRDPSLLNSYFGLAKACLRMEKYKEALNAIDPAEKLDPGRTDIHYVRGQILLHMGRKEEGRKELETAVRIDNEKRAVRQKQVETGTVPSPELLQDDQ
jgi:tetratricopeptide (TPR) repeat protein